MNAENILRALNIAYTVRESGNGVAYIVECPYCTKGKHKAPSGAFFASGKLTYTCWRGCGRGISAEQVLSEMSNTPIKEVYDIISEYCNDTARTPFKCVSRGILPQLSVIPIDDTYSAYIEARGINPAFISDRVLFTPHIPYFYDIGLEGVKPIRMDNRVVFPLWDKQKRLITFTGRTIDKNNKLRYLFPTGCTYNMKDYGWSFDNSDDTAVIVEGAFDALKFGSHAHCCCGINFTTGFANNIIRRYRRAIVLFDPEVKAQQQARSLMSMLDMFMDVVYVKYPYSHDIGDCSKDEIRRLRSLCGLDDTVPHLL